MGVTPRIYISSTENITFNPALEHSTAHGNSARNTCRQHQLSGSQCNVNI